MNLMDIDARELYENEELIQLKIGHQKSDSSTVAAQEFVPKYVAMDKKVIKFQACKKETVEHSPIEHNRVRTFHIFYYLENDTISVFEPRVENSGLNQVCFSL